MKKKILFIEDESALHRALEKSLSEAGYEMTSALNGEIGLERAQRDLPHLILLDLILPIKNGFEVLEELKRDPRTASIPIIVLSNLADSEDVERAIERGATTYLVKTNYKLDEVVEKIRQTIGIS